MERPDVLIKVFTKIQVDQSKKSVLQKLKKTNGLLLSLNENVSNVFDQPYPFITFKRIGSSDKLPDNLKNDGDPFSDFFITLSSIKKTSSGGGSGSSYKSSSSSRNHKSGFIILAFKVLDDDKTHLFDQTWNEWTGTSNILAQLAKQYQVRKVACYKGVNVIPDVFKYMVLIEFIIDEELGQSDMYALDCMQKFRITRMSGYAACYTDYHSKDIEQAIDETESVGAIMESFDN
jgi:hypothetical protein